MFLNEYHPQSENRGTEKKQIVLRLETHDTLLGSNKHISDKIETLINRLEVQVAKLSINCVSCNFYEQAHSNCSICPLTCRKIIPNLNGSKIQRPFPLMNWINILWHTYLLFILIRIVIFVVILIDSIISGDSNIVFELLHFGPRNSIFDSKYFACNNFIINDICITTL